jgi:hypothetical protein
MITDSVDTTSISKVNGRMINKCGAAHGKRTGKRLR